MKHTLLYIVILISMPVSAQLSIETDTVRINEVVISRKKDISQPGFKKVELDSSILMNYNQSTLAQVLSDHTGIFIKSYGMGGTATPSFRGTGASHTQVTWNGINIDHPMLGQSDLALIPAGMIDGIQIFYGAASMPFNSGGIGGAINLETKPLWKKETSIIINPGTGSFGRYSGLFSFKSGNTEFQTITKIIFQSSENNFRYLNTELLAPVWETRNNSQVLQKGFMQEFYFRKLASIFSARVWYETADRNLPSTLLTMQPGLKEKQFDESLRTLLNLDINKTKFKYSVTGAWIMNKLNYKNNLALIDSRNLSNLFIIKGAMDTKIGSDTKLRAELSEDFNVIKSNNYSGNITRNTSTLTASLDHEFSERISATLLLREIIDRSRILAPDFSTAAKIRLLDSREYFIKANFSRNSKIPSMNDMYWVPGGNPDLKNEYAYIYEISYEMNQSISTPLTFSYNLTGFKNTIKDMILWHPGEFSYWTADNIQSVNTMGVETSLSFDYRISDISAKFIAGYSFTRANDVSNKENGNDLSGKQLIYMPENQLNGSLRFNYKMIYAAWLSNFMGQRYLTADNSNYLPSYLLNGITAGWKINIKENVLDINFNIDNLFDINYQTIAFYPMPGRSYFLKILFQIVK